MSGEIPIILTTGSSSAANGVIYVSDPFVHLQNVNPCTSMAFGHVYPSNPLQLQREESVPTQHRATIEEMGGGSGGYEQNAGLSSNDVQQTGPIERRRSRRHSPQQIQGLEAAFNECPYPDREQRQKLSGDLGLSTLQVIYWFQNRRNQEKIIQDRIENAALKAMLGELKRGNVTQLIKELKSEIINLKAEHVESKKEGPQGARPSDEVELLLQESYSNESERVVAYTSLNEAEVEKIMYGTDPSIIRIQPLGYEMVPINRSTMLHTSTSQTSCLGLSPQSLSSTACKH